MPEERIVCLGTSISLMRTGILCARRTHSKVALTFCSKLFLVGFCVSPIPRGMLSTSPLIGGAPLNGVTMAKSPILTKLSLVSSRLRLDSKGLLIDYGQDWLAGVCAVAHIEHQVGHITVDRRMHKNADQNVFCSACNDLECRYRRLCCRDAYDCRGISR